jgi:hypothetical protein
MTEFDDLGGEVRRCDLIEELIDDLTADTAAGAGAETLVTEFLLELRSRYATPALPEVRAALSEFVDVGLGNRRDLPSTATSTSHEHAAHTLVQPVWETAATTRRFRVSSYIAGFLGTLTGKVVLGATVATASVGGAQATGVIDIPTLPSPNDDSSVVEIDDAPVGDGEDGPEAEVEDGPVADADDGEVDDVDDGEVGDVDDGEVGDVEVGEVGDVDDGEVGDVEDGEVGDVDDGEVGDVDDGPEAEAEDCEVDDVDDDPQAEVGDGGERRGRGV